MTRNAERANDSFFLILGKNIHLLAHLLRPICRRDAMNQQQIDVICRKLLEKTIHGNVCIWFVVALPPDFRNDVAFSRVAHLSSPRPDKYASHTGRRNQTSGRRAPVHRGGCDSGCRGQGGFDSIDVVHRSCPCPCKGGILSARFCPGERVRKDQNTSEWNSSRWVPCRRLQWRQASR